MYSELNMFPNVEEYDAPFYFVGLQNGNKGRCNSSITVCENVDSYEETDNSGFVFGYLQTTY